MKQPRGKVAKPEIRQRIIETVFVKASELKKNPLNFRTHPEDQRRDVEKLLEEIGQVAGLLARRESDGSILLLDGHLRTDIADDRVLRVDITDLTEEEGRLILALFDRTTGMAGINLAKAQGLLAGLQASRPGWRLQLSDAAKAMQAQARQAAQRMNSSPGGVASITLAERFGAPPFSVLDTRSGTWQDRKRAWLSIGVRATHSAKRPADAGADKVEHRLMGSDAANDPDYYRRKAQVEAMLGEKISIEEFQRFYYEQPDRYAGGSSSSDPVLAELMLKWFSPQGGSVFDPFGGPSAIGIVAAWLGMKLTAIEIRQDQCDENRAVWKSVLEQFPESKGKPSPLWLCGDSGGGRMINTLPEQEAFDIVYTSPPYFDLERYSGGNADGSAFKSYAEFVRWLGMTARDCAARLKQNRFFVWKVGEVRDPETGVYRNFVADCVAVCQRAGLLYYNEIILLNAVGSVCTRAGRQFGGTRKIGRVHQTMLVFYKGDPSKIKEHFPATVGGCDLPEDVGAGDAAESA